MQETTLLRGAKALVGLRFVTLLVGSFLPLTLPETWRQTDTLGVALRFWLRWSAEAAPPPWFLPAVLNSGDTNGVMPMELPLLNLLTAPAFAFGPELGRSLAVLLHNLLCFALTVAAARAWRGVRVRGASAELAIWILPLTSFSLIYFGRFMPDYLSLILVVLATGLSWRRPRPALSFFLASLGLLMKPTSVVVFALYLLRPGFWRELRGYLPWVAAATLAAVLYYTMGLRAIDRYREGPSLFAVGWRPFAQSVVEFFSQPRDLGRFFFSRIFFPGGVLLVMGHWLYRRVRGEATGFPGLFAVFTLQLIAVAGLDGTHGFSHDYYFLGLAPTCALGLVGLARRLRSRAVLALFLLLGTAPALEACWASVKTLYKHGLAGSLALPRECRALRAAHPEIPWGRGLVFRASAEDYPVLGLCFGERQGSATAAHGFYWTYSALPAGCEEIGRRERIKLARCVSP